MRGPFTGNFYKPQDEKRSAVILPPDRYHDCLRISGQVSRVFLRVWAIKLTTDA